MFGRVKNQAKGKMETGTCLTDRFGPFRPSPSPFLGLLLGLATSALTWAAETEPDEDKFIETITVVAEVEDRIGILGAEASSTVFGFDKALLETPRSVSSITIETIEQYGITDINDFVVLSPGSFTQSFFGVAGSLDLRGTSGENYFNGVRRLDNPGNYATPISAADRVDIVRGPASVISGPSKIGGYMNFIPKSARAEEDRYLASPTGALSFTGGSWSKSILSAEVGGPGGFADRDFGYYLYGELEDSGSHYQNTSTDNLILQATINMDLADNIHIDVGGMYQHYKSNEVAGWNRLTQALVDDGSYLTGVAKPLDRNNDGFISHQEYGTANDGNGNSAFVVDPASVNGPVPLGPDFALDPATIGVARLNTDQVLVAPDDTLNNKDLVLYLDFVVQAGRKWTLTNKLFYEGYDNLNENAYGFAQLSDSWVIEDQFIVKYTDQFNALKLNLLLSPSIRHTSFEHGVDFTNEHFDRRDLTLPSSALDRRLLATEIDDDYSDYFDGHFTIYGLSLLADLDFNNGLNLLLGARYDAIDMTSRQPGEKVLSGLDLDASDNEDTFSWTASLSYKTPLGLVPYLTVSEQTTIVVGQGAQIDAPNITAGRAVAGSELFEVGVKGSLWNDRLFAQAIYYQQERTDFSAQATDTNQATETEGFEFELRWLATANLTITAAYTNIKVVNLNTLELGGRFSFLGAGDLPDTDPALFYGGTVSGFVTLAGNPKARRAGVPENLLSLSALYDFTNGLQLFGSLIAVDSVYSGFSQSVQLPAYTLVNAGLQYHLGSWSLTFSGKNLTNEKYFRANFPNLFGSAVVLPELPRHYQANLEYRF